MKRRISSVWLLTLSAALIPSIASATDDVANLRAWAIAQAPALDPVENGKVLVASNTLQLSADTERSGPGGTKIKEFLLPYSGKIRVSWELKGDGTGPVFLYVKSTVDTCNATNEGTAYEAGTCTIRVVAGDILEVYGNSVFDAGLTPTVSIRKVRIYYDVRTSSGTGQVLSN